MGYQIHMNYQPLRPIFDIDVRQKPDPLNPELPSLDKITCDDLI